MTALFDQSSQLRDWIFSPAELERVRSELNQAAVDRVRAKVEEESEAIKAEDSTLAANEIEYLTVQDEISLVTFYLTKIPQLAKAFHFNDAVASTAMSYLKRFYLRNTCMDYHPKNVMLTCLFLATKTENQVISIAQFASKIKQTTPSSILSLEFLVSQSLKFQYKVHHALLAAYGILLDLQQALPEACPPPDVLQKVFQQVDTLLRTARLTDLEFLYLPSQIALATFHTFEPDLISSWLATKTALLPQQTAEQAKSNTEQVLKTLEEIKVMLEASKTVVNLDAVRLVDKRLKFCKNPEKDPTSALYKKRQAEAEADIESKRAAKKAKIEPPAEDDDPFGPPPTGQSVAKKEDDPFASTLKPSILPDSAQIDAPEKGKPSGLRPTGTPPETDPDRKV